MYEIIYFDRYGKRHTANVENDTLFYQQNRNTDITIISIKRVKQNV